MAKLQEEERKKKKSKEAEEIISAIGEEGKKGRGYAKEYFTEQEAKIKKEENRELNMLDSKKDSFSTYNSLLADLLIKRLSYVSWPVGWGSTVAHTKDGVIMEVKDPEGKFYRAAFAPVMDPLYDLNAVDMYAVRAENTMDRVTGADQNEENGKT